jgi:hypothetical protein
LRGVTEEERNAELSKARIHTDEKIRRIFVAFDCPELEASIMAAGLPS